jgi:hypothetical protein
VEWLTCQIDASASCRSVTASALSRFGRFDRADMFAARFCHCAGDKQTDDTPLARLAFRREADLAPRIADETGPQALI